MSDIDNQIKERIHAIFPSPEIASKVVDLVVDNRPPGWSFSSKAPYYKEMYAKQIRDEIDKMLKSRENIVYRYAVWCEGEQGMSKNTLYARINQSLKYLITKMDPHKIYHDWYQMINITRHSEGVLIEFNPEFKESGVSTFKGESVQPRLTNPRWKIRLEDWMESDNMSPYVQEGLVLTNDEVKDLKVQFAGLKGFLSSITNSAIKIVKVNA